MSVEELQAEYKEVLGKEAAGPHKNKVEWLEKKIAEAKDETVEVAKPEKVVKAGFGFELNEGVIHNGKAYAKGEWVDESLGIPKKYAK